MTLIHHPEAIPTATVLEVLERLGAQTLHNLDKTNPGLLFLYRCVGPMGTVLTFEPPAAAIARHLALGIAQRGHGPSEVWRLKTHGEEEAEGVRVHGDGTRATLWRGLDMETLKDHRPGAISRDIAGLLRPGRPCSPLLCIARFYRPSTLPRWPQPKPQGRSKAVLAKGRRVRRRPPTATPEIGIPPDLDPAGLAVVADRLQDQGSARGEHLMLQLLEPRTPEQQRRMVDLERAHHSAWLQPIHSIVSHPRYEGGVLAEATVDVANPERLAEVAESRVWASVHTVRLRGGRLYGAPAPQVLSWLGGPAMGGVRRVYSAPFEALRLPVQWDEVSFPLLARSRLVGGQASVAKLVFADDAGAALGCLEDFCEDPPVRGLRTLQFQRCRDPVPCALRWMRHGAPARFVVTGGSRLHGWTLDLSTEGDLQLRLFNTALERALSDLEVARVERGIRSIRLGSDLEGADLESVADALRALCPAATVIAESIIP